MTTRALSPLLLLCSIARAQTLSSVQGTVLDSVTHQPVRKAAVTLTALSPDRSYAVAITDAAGHYNLPGIPPGRYRIIAGHGGFLSVPYRSVLQVTAAEARTGVTLLLTPAIKVTGAVTDPEGDGVPGIEIVFYKKGWDRGQPHYIRSFQAVTDQQGRYKAGPALTGEFMAATQTRNARVFRAHPVSVPGEKIPDEAFASQIYPSPVIVRPDRDTTDIDFHLNYAPQVSLHGTVSGIPETAKYVAVTLRNSELAESIRIPFDQAKSSFFIAGLTAGTYRVEVQAGTRRAFSQAPLLSMGTEVNIALEPGVAIGGSIKIENPGATKITRQSISLSSRDGGTAMNLQSRVEDGEFEFEEVPAGIWDIGIHPLPDGFYIKSIHIGSRDLLLNNLEIGSGPQGPLDIVISGAAPKVEGTVDPPQAVTVLAAPTGTRFFRTVQSDETGHFTIRGLNPGAYRFYAFHDLDPESWQAPNFLRSFESQSKFADLKEGTTETLTLPIIGAGKR